EHGDHDGLVGARDDGLERFADALFAARRPGRVDVRRIAEQEVDALARELSEALHVEHFAVGRRVVELEVASAVASAIECVTRTGSTTNEPTRSRARGLTQRRSAWASTSCSAARSRRR